MATSTPSSSGKRRLPVVQSPRAPSGGGDDADDASRPPWHWVGFGVVIIFAAWLPLAYVSGAVQARMFASRFGEGASRDQIELALAAMTSAERASLTLTQAIPGVLALALASFAGGVVVGRFGLGTGVRETARAGALVAIIAMALSLREASLASLVSALVLLLVATGFAAWGGRVGASSKSASPG